MKYYSFIGRNISLFDFDKHDINEFAVEADKDKNVFKVCFDENSIGKFFDAIDYKSNFQEENRVINFFGADSHVYSFFADRTIKKLDKYKSSEERKIWKSYVSYEKKLAKSKLQLEGMIKKYDDGIHFIKSGLNGYDKYVYVCADEGVYIPFRFKATPRN